MNLAFLPCHMPCHAMCVYYSFRTSLHSPYIFLFSVNLRFLLAYLLNLAIILRNKQRNSQTRKINMQSETMYLCIVFKGAFENDVESRYDCEKKIVLTFAYFSSVLCVPRYMRIYYEGFSDIVISWFSFSLASFIRKMLSSLRAGTVYSHMSFRFSVSESSFSWIKDKGNR